MALVLSLCIQQLQPYAEIGIGLRVGQTGLLVAVGVLSYFATLILAGWRWRQWLMTD